MYLAGANPSAQAIAIKPVEHAPQIDAGAATPISCRLSVAYLSIGVRVALRLAVFPNPPVAGVAPAELPEMPGLIFTEPLTPTGTGTVTGQRRFHAHWVISMSQLQNVPNCRQQLPNSTLLKTKLRGSQVHDGLVSGAMPLETDVPSQRISRSKSLQLDPPPGQLSRRQTSSP